ncbi:fanconi anemia group J protein homolog [Trichonephila clavata]|uniref:DNA 5'-3' helicase n=1 Tax=Trichonephila clavata TaxID=2740835 RepID=A0A8X6FV54_TRICU|nr:fanconi anemia group J protein homolog [Trichonephila clavata]
MEHNDGSISEASENYTGKAYMIGGVPIIFPYKAYPSQITMMDKIIKCLNKKQNCLLESPTGSGKSLALLCACLAWQKKMKKLIDSQERELENELNAYGTSIPDNKRIGGYHAVESTVDNVESTPEGINSSKNILMNKMSSHKNKINKGIIYIDNLSCSENSTKINTHCIVNSPVVQCDKTSMLNKFAPDTKSLELENSKRGSFFSCDDNDIEDFQPPKKYRHSIDRCNVTIQNNCAENVTLDHGIHLSRAISDTLKVDSSGICSSTGTISDSLKVDNSGACSSTGTKKEISKEMGETTIPTKLPRIYFGTRTHKQIEQIIRELKKTPYKDAKMTILSSRERTCIHPQASKKDNKNEACDELLKADGGPKCGFYRNAKSINHYQNKKFGSAFDLEEFVKICRNMRTCPYFGSRELLIAADIVFCPYNYLVDPLIRSAMNISLKGSIVITDEAHNIEDSARESASGSLTLSVLQEAVLDLEKAGRHSETIPECYQYIAQILTELVKWLKSNSDNLTDYVSFDSSAKVWQGDEMMAVLNHVKLGPEYFSAFKTKFEKILAEEAETEKETPIDMDQPKLLGSTLQCLKNFTLILSYIFKNGGIFVPDYRFVVMKSKILSTPQSKKKFSTYNPFEITLHLWCLNPAVAFSDFKGATHSIIVASGTLSPLTSFQTELDIPFQITLEANHVISKSQLWVGTIGKGPNNNSLTATFHNSATFTFQDDIGELIYQICCVIPHGILCFLPSYSMLDKLLQRWQITGLYNKLLSKKVVLSEPRKQNEFVEVIKDFYNVVDETKDSESTVDGALLLAICRGKVSEGLDFADNNARAVITVGIPFPSIKDAQVDLKKKYNNMYCSKKQIMSGQDWYQIQAFRALNQALGRCIRHKEDFGALIIVDERFQKNSHYSDALSKWIRKEIVHFPSFSSALSSLNDFAERMAMKKIATE